MTSKARIGRRASFAVGFLVAIAGVMLPLFAAFDAVEIAPGVIQSDFAEQAFEVRSRMAAERREFDLQVLMLGDSMLLPGKKMKYRDAVPAMLSRALRREFPRPEKSKVYSFAFPGAGYTSFYYLLDHLIAARADLILIGFNPASLSPHWARRWARPDHAAWLGWRRVPEALGLPLHRLSLTVDRLLWTVACVEMGCGDAWRFVQHEQLRASDLLEHVRAELASMTGMNAVDDLRDRRNAARVEIRRGGPTPRLRTADEYRKTFESFLDGVMRDDAALRMLAATVRGIRSAGIPVVVYVTPVNVGGMKRRGVWNQAGIDRTLVAIEATVAEAGGVFLDFHDLLPEARFRDYADHLTFRGYLNGQALLVARLAPVVAENLRRAAGASD